jgi:hypothetical protein
MALQDKTSTTKPASYTPGQVPDFPHVNPDLINVPGMREQQTRNQSWWANVKQSLFKQFQGDGIDIARNGASIKEEATIREEADGFLEGKYTLQVTAGNVVTGMVITSSTAPDGGTVSEVTFQTDRFKIYNGVSGQTMFDVSGTTVRLGGTMVVNTTGNKVYIGAGNYSNADTAWFVDSTGRMSLKNKLTWDGTTLTITGSITATSGTIGGWTIGASTLTGGNATLDSAGQLILGTANDIIYVSASDVTYRLWVGNVLSASAAFSVTKAGALFSNSGTIGGWTIGATTLTAGAGNNFLSLDTANARLEAGALASAHTLFNFQGVTAYDGSAVLGYGQSGRVVTLYNTSGVQTIQMDGSNGQISTTGNLICDLVRANNASGGSASTPNYSFGTDTNTGMYTSGADELSFSTGGTRRHYIDSAGTWQAVYSANFTSGWAATGSCIISGGGLSVANAVTLSSTLAVTSSITSGGYIKVTGSVNVPGGTGVEIFYDSGTTTGKINCYDRGAAAYRDIAIQAAKISLGETTGQRVNFIAGVTGGSPGTTGTPASWIACKSNGTDGYIAFYT